MDDCAHGTESIPVVIGTCAGLTAASVLMRRKRVSRSRFVEDVVSWPRGLVESRNERGSKEASGCVR